MTTGLTYGQRNALAILPAIAPLAKGALTYTPGKPQFAALEASMMGDMGTSSDGFDSILNLLLLAGSVHDAMMADMDTSILAAVFTPGAIVSGLYNALAVQMAAVAKAGDALLADFDSTLAGTSGGGGGGGGGGNTGGGGRGSPGGIDGGGGNGCDGRILRVLHDATTQTAALGKFGKNVAQRKFPCDPGY